MARRSRSNTQLPFIKSQETNLHVFRSSSGIQSGKVRLQGRIFQNLGEPEGPVTALGFWRDEVGDEHRPSVAHAHCPGDHQEECSASIHQILDNVQMGTQKNSRVHAEMFFERSSRVLYHKRASVAFVYVPSINSMTTLVRS